MSSYCKVFCRFARVSVIWRHLIMPRGYFDPSISFLSAPSSPSEMGRSCNGPVLIMVRRPNHIVLNTSAPVWTNTIVKLFI
jgi:hypothetical protein